jgi:hypothetical protein
VQSSDPGSVRPGLGGVVTLGGDTPSSAKVDTTLIPPQPAPIDTITRSAPASAPSAPQSTWSSLLGAFNTGLTNAKTARDHFWERAGHIYNVLDAKVHSFADRMLHKTQPPHSTACFVTCDRMGASVGLTFAGKGSPGDVPYTGIESGRRLLAALMSGIPVKIPVDYKPGGNLTDPGYAADHCVVARYCAGTNPPMVTIYDPRSDREGVREQTLELDMATGELKGGPYPYRITDLRFPTSYVMAGDLPTIG